jgi:hypothetical protein
MRYIQPAAPMPTEAQVERVRAYVVATVRRHGGFTAAARQLRIAPKTARTATREPWRLLGQTIVHLLRIADGRRVPARKKAKRATASARFDAPGVIDLATRRKRDKRKTPRPSCANTARRDVTVLYFSNRAGAKVLSGGSACGLEDRNLCAVMELALGGCMAHDLDAHGSQANFGELFGITAP